MAFERLEDEDCDVVLGPTDDGGYYLIGCKEHHERLVTDIQMSTPRVLADTLAVAAELGLRVTLLPQWFDIDESGDLDRLRSEIADGIACGRHTEAWLDEH
jgi:glycosyltransferase A (GT-A) superfamily protein (DUF2064 family)